MKSILPKNLVIAEHVNTYPPADYNLIGFKDDNASYILSLITTIPARNKDIADKLEENGHYVPMYSKLLQSVVHNYRAYLNYFINTGIIESDNIYISESFQQGEAKSYGYRFCDKYRNKETIVLDYSWEFISKLDKRQKSAYNDLRKDYGHLTKWLWPVCKLKIDVENAMLYIRTKQVAQINNPLLLEDKKDDIGRVIQKDPIVQFNYSKLNIFELNVGNMNCEVDGTVQRMHTTLTNLKSELRNFLSFGEGNERLVSIDIANSQPYIALTMFNNYKGLVNNNKVFNNNINNKLQQILPMLENLFQSSTNEDFKLYLSLVSNVDKNSQDIYTYMQQQSLKQIGITYKSRSEVKLEMLKVFFSSNRHHTDTKKLFSMLFPSVNEVFTTIKSKQKNLLACVLQSLESYIVLNIITKKIARRYPNIPLFTIHDSVATTSQYKDVVYKFMEDELTKAVGYPPKLKLEYWLPENIDWKRYEITD